ncbi:MAG: hypothetical protein AMJ55_09920 [Gammaproteobacteria bacterium SG8_15]|nr:MAG: hypothetical protein AMJ55_09920 [Gammaproteobacteria bacterium SG8_15]
MAESTVLASGDETFKIEVGYYLPSFNTRLRLDSKTLGVGDEVDMEDDIGLHRELGILRFNGHYRFASRHRVLFGYYSFDRSSTRIIDEEFQIGDQVYPVNTTITSTTDATIIDLHYMYSLAKTKDYEFAAGLGLHTISWQWDFRETGGGQATTSKATAPLPLLGLSFDYTISQNWRAGALAQFLALTMDGYEGQFTNVRASIEYSLYKNIALGFGLDAFDMDISEDRSELQGRLRWSYTGAQVYTNIYF